LGFATEIDLLALTVPFTVVAMPHPNLIYILGGILVSVVNFTAINATDSSHFKIEFVQWEPSYYSSSVGGASFEVLKQYIQHQEKPS
jgi:hypothetical protein